MTQLNTMIVYSIIASKQVANGNFVQVNEKLSPVKGYAGLTNNFQSYSICFHESLRRSLSKGQICWQKVSHPV